MTRTEAKAILQCKATIERALKTCLSKLSNEQLETAENYWAAHIKAGLDGYSYGSAPINLCHNILDQ